MSLDIKKYEVLLSTLDKGCFAKACEDLGYTQPAITHMMKSMEREIGFPLLKRSNKGIQLTSEGREVLPLIRELVAANDRLNKHYDMLRGVETGSVRVGTFPTVGGAWLPRIIAQFEKKYPQIQIDVLEENSIHKIEEWLTGGRIDVAFFARQPYHTFDWIPLKMDPYYGILPLEHELTSYDRLTAADFENQPFLMCCSMEGPDLDITRFFQQHGVTIRSRFNSNQDFTIARMVEAGLGVAILPELLLTSQLTGTCHVETVVLLSHKKADSYIHIDVEFGEGEGKIPVDSIAKRAEAYKPKEKVTYKMIKEYIEAKYGFKVHTAYIAEVKRNLGLPMYDAPNAVEELKQPRKHPTPEKVEAIKDALRYFAVI